MGHYFELIDVYWNTILNYTGDSKYIWHVFGLNIGMAIVYWIIGIIYLFMDITKTPRFLQKYKVKRKNEVKITWSIMKKVIIQVCFNQIVVGIVFTTVMYPVLVIRGTPNLRTIPTINQLVVEFYCCWFVREVLFYYLHRIVHHRYLYEAVHKKHHGWTAPIAVSAEYCTAWEHILTNLVPTLIGPVIAAAHYFTYFIWYLHVILSTLQKHSGYNFPWYYNSTRHNDHHKSFTTNYGLIGIMDWLHGTSYKSVKKS